LGLKLKKAISQKKYLEKVANKRKKLLIKKEKRESRHFLEAKNKRELEIKKRMRLVEIEAVKKKKELVVSKKQRIDDVEKKRQKIVSSYPIGSRDWLKELKKNSSKH